MCIITLFYRPFGVHNIQSVLEMDCAKSRCFNVHLESIRSIMMVRNGTCSLVVVTVIKASSVFLDLIEPKKVFPLEFEDWIGVCVFQHIHYEIFSSDLESFTFRLPVVYLSRYFVQNNVFL